MEEKTTMVIDETTWRVGNFIIRRASAPSGADPSDGGNGAQDSTGKGDGFKYLSVASVSGHWSVSYRDDNEMYGKLMAMAALREESRVKSEESSVSLLEMEVLWLYHNTNMMIDAGFANEYFSALERLRDRMAKAQGEPTEEEEDAALAEAELLAGTALHDLS